MNAIVYHIPQQKNQFRPDTGTTLNECPETDDHSGTNDFGREWITDSAEMTINQIFGKKTSFFIAFNRLVLIISEACIDSIYQLFIVDLAVINNVF